MPETNEGQLPNLGLVFDTCPEPCALLEGDTIIASNAAFRAHFSDVTSWRACIEAADHSVLGDRKSPTHKFVARPALGQNSGRRMQWTAWSVSEQLLCVRLDGPAGPEIPNALKHMFAEPLSLGGLIAGKAGEQIDAAMWAFAKDGTVLVSEGKGLAHFGLQPGQIVGMNAHQLYPEGSTAKLSMVRALNGESVREEQIDKDGQWFRMCEPVRDEHGEVVAMIGFAWCSTETAREVNQARALLHAVAELPVTVWAMDADGTCTLSVGKGLRHFGMESGQLVGQNLLHVYPAQSETHHDILHALKGESIAREIRLGDMTWFSTLLPIFDPLGDKVVQVYGVAENVTERSRTQQHMEEQLALIKSQQDTLAALTSPIIEVWQGILVVPLIGALDEQRAGRLLEHLLAEVVHRQSRAVILDLTGTPVADTSTAQYLVDIMRSVRLLGAEGLVSGIRPSVARAMVELDVAATSWRTFPTLAEALRRIIGKRLNAL